MVKTPCSQCRKPGFDPWFRELRSYMPHGMGYKTKQKVPGSVESQQIILKYFSGPRPDVDRWI